ncbi:hypothetical protein BLJ79_08635 [Arthrobacter sp. UCD-GKA]|uniref:MFS transporter n=1 Tax=Arthrobacter sp. UCD-GKA TaxID=1913576 RepID=UPI0008DDF357|nr:MFS transporter [Arthrobacter sp. UCD-GKA]OIH85236.1 hypothetical protein BLJ79_08635 [Arthrobacter sp. UCD-GKA]
MAQPLRATALTWTGTHTLALTAILLLTLNLRTALASVSPIAVMVGRDVSLDSVQLGVLGMAPAVAFAVSGLFSAAVSRRTGLELALLSSLAIMVGAHFARSMSNNFGTFLVSTIIILLAAGVGGILLPPYIKLMFGPRAVAISSLYLCAISASTALPPVLAVPVANALGWRASLNVWTLLAAVALVPWFVAWFRSRLPARAKGPTASTELGAQSPPLTNVLRSRTFWALALLHALNTFFTFTVFAWLPTLLAERSGMSVRDSGWMLGLFSTITVPLAFAIPWLIRRVNRQHRLIYSFAACLVAGWGGLLLVPTTAPWVWVVFMSVGTGLFVVYQVFLIQRTNSPSTTASTSGYSQTIGYLLGGIGPLLVGLLHQWTDGWTVALLFMLGVSLLVFVVGYLFKDGRSVDPADHVPTHSSNSESTSQQTESGHPADFDKIGES